MLIILGKTASGKTTVLDNLLEHGYKKITTYTSRPKRKHEDENSYHFISEEEFLEKIRDGFFAEWSHYDTSHGRWYYGSARKDYLNADDKTVVILNPSGYRSIMGNVDVENIKTVYLYANLQTIRERLKKRGDKKEEIERRIIADNLDFKGMEMQVDKIVYNGSCQTIDDAVQKIIEFTDYDDKKKEEKV